MFYRSHVARGEEIDAKSSANRPYSNQTNRGFQSKTDLNIHSPNISVTTGFHTDLDFILNCFEVTSQVIGTWVRMIWPTWPFNFRAFTPACGILTN